MTNINYTPCAGLLQEALDFCARGFSVVPLAPRGKTPLVPWVAYQQRRATEGEINAWWTRWPDANIGIVTGAISGLVVLDVDGEPGSETLKREKLHLPLTLVSRTGGGGWHYIFKHPGHEVRSFTRKLPGLDLRADGGYIVAPPSVHPSGEPYRWAVEEPPAPLPAWLIELIKGHQEQAATVLPAEAWGAVVNEGGRNAALAQRAGSLLTRMSAADALPMLLAWNAAHCRPPLSDQEVRAVITSIAQREHKKRGGPSKVVALPKPATSQAVPTATPTAAGFITSELGNAERLAARHGQDLRFCYPWNSWLAWDGQRWQRDSSGRTKARAKDTVRSIYGEAAACYDEATRTRLGKWALLSEKKASIDAMVDLAKSEDGVPILPEELDAKPWLLNVQNGTIDLQKGTLRPHSRADLLTIVAPVAYDPQAVAPVWDAFLDRIMAGNDELIGFLRRCVGYSLTGDISAQALFFLYGSGANGKTTFSRALQLLLGDYAKQASPELLLLRRGESHPAGLADIRGARFLVATEIDQGRQLAESLVKQLTGGDKIKARLMYENFSEFEMTGKIWLAANHKPVIKGTDYAIWRRIKLVPFLVTIPKAEQDPHLLQKLQTEAAGILAWAVRGCLEWQKNGLDVPDVVEQATASYRDEMDLLGEFLTACCTVERRAEVSAKELYTAYAQWCEDNGEKAISQRAVSNAIRERGFDRYKNRDRFYIWLGISLLS